MQFPVSVQRIGLLGAAAALAACAAQPAAPRTPPSSVTTGAGTRLYEQETGPVRAAPPSAVPSPAGAPAVAPQELAFPKEDFRNLQPQAAKPRDFRLPGLHRFKLDKPGIEVFLVERHGLPTVSLGLSFDGGAVNDPKGKEGLASVCMSMLQEGTQRLDKLAFEEAQADLASEINAWAATDEQGASMSSLSKHLDRTLDLFAEMVLTPGFRKVDLDRLIARRLESLKQSKAAVASVSGRVQGVVGYGPTHAFGRLETETSYAAMSTGDCVAYHKTWLKPRGARLFVVGDIDEAGIQAAFARRFAAFTGAPKKSATLGTARPPKGRVFFVSIEKSAQSSVSLVSLGPKRNAPDFFATDMMARIFGGGFSGRLNMNLREDKGWAYGARGGFSYHRQGSTFFASAQVQTDHTTEALSEIVREIAALKNANKPATDVELSREKDGSILGLPAQFATAQQVLSMYRELLRFELPLDYYNSYVAKVTAVLPAQVAAAAGKRLTPSSLRALVVGDPAAVLPGLYALTAKQELGAGDLVILDADGREKERVSAQEAARRAAKPVAK